MRVYSQPLQFGWNPLTGPLKHPKIDKLKLPVSQQRTQSTPPSPASPASETLPSADKPSRLQTLLPFLFRPLQLWKTDALAAPATTAKMRADDLLRHRFILTMITTKGTSSIPADCIQLDRDPQSHQPFIRVTIPANMENDVIYGLRHIENNPDKGEKLTRHSAKDPNTGLPINTGIDNSTRISIGNEFENLRPLTGNTDTNFQRMNLVYAGIFEADEKYKHPQYPITKVPVLVFTVDSAFRNKRSHIGHRGGITMEI